MRELEDTDFERLMNAPAIREGLAAIEARRKAAMRRFMLVLTIAAIILGGQFYYLYLQDMAIFGVAIFVIAGVFTVAIAIRGLWKVNEALKSGILTEAARIAGMRYALHSGDHPVISDAQSFLFSRGDSSRTSDRFEAELEDGRTVGFFEMSLSHEVVTRRTDSDGVGRDDKSTVTDFSGQMFAYSRASPGEGIVAVRPRIGLPGPTPPVAVKVSGPGFTGTTRSVELGDDPPFEAEFDIHTSDPALARAVLVPELRRLLLELRATEKIWFYCGPRHILFGLWGSNKFEGGGVLRNRPIEARARAMVDDLNASIRTMRRLIEVVG